MICRSKYEYWDKRLPLFLIFCGCSISVIRRIADEEKGYYADGEDAFSMKKRLKESSTSTSTSTSNGPMNGVEKGLAGLTIGDKAAPAEGGGEGERRKVQA